MIVKEYALRCDVKSEMCGDEHATRVLNHGMSGWSDQVEMLSYAERVGWRAVATRQNGVVRMMDACPDCAATTPGAV